MTKSCSIDFVSGWHTIFVDQIASNNNSGKDLDIKQLLGCKSWVDMVELKSFDVLSAISTTTGVVGCISSLKYVTEHTNIQCNSIKRVQDAVTSLWVDPNFQERLRSQVC